MAVHLSHRSIQHSGFAAFALCAVLVGALSGDASAVVDISKATGPVAPSFRGAANTTWFGWGTGQFDGPDNDNLLDNPPPSIGTTTAGVGFVQNTAATILSGGNNIYSAGNNLDVTITAPTAGTPGTGFTTILLQGNTAFGPFGSAFSFKPVAGVTPTVTIGANLTGADQFFVKYQIPGNAATYPINFTAGTNQSIGNLQVDTSWSATGYAADFAVTPEPTAMAAIAALGVGALIRRRRAV